MLVSTNVAHRELVVEQIGNNPSAINGVKLKRGEKRKAVEGDIIEVLASEHRFKVEFPRSSLMDSNNTHKKDDCLADVKNTSKTTGTLDYFLKNSALKQVGHWDSVIPDSLFVFSSDYIESREKVITNVMFAKSTICHYELKKSRSLVFTYRISILQISAFDLDGTIITTHSGNVYPKDTNDWKIAYPNVIEKLKELHSDGYKIVFFTNQGGIASGKLKLSDFKKKVEAIVRKINVPVQVFVSGRDDICRKPRSGMWHCLVQKVSTHIEFYVFVRSYFIIFTF